MQVLAGHPQYVFYTAVAAGIYSLLCLVRTGERLKVGFGLAAICIGGAALSAVQLLTGLAESGETLRPRCRKVNRSKVTRPNDRPGVQEPSKLRPSPVLARARRSAAGA